MVITMWSEFTLKSITITENNTMKGVIGVAPCSAIVYVSPMYPGGVSDREVIQHCGLLKLLDSPGDNIMADKGFLVDDLLEEGEFPI